MSFRALDGLKNEAYISLTTYRRDGRAVPTPVWFVRAGDELYVSTGPNTGKAKRIRNNQHVEVFACSMSGKPHGEPFAATARIIIGPDVARVERLLGRKYGGQWWLVTVRGRLERFFRGGQRLSVILAVRPTER